MKNSHLDIARNSFLLSGCPEDIVLRILKRAVVKNFERGQLLFNHGDEAFHVYIVMEGWVKLFRISPNGSEAVVNVITRGFSFAEAVALRRSRFPVSAEAATDCDVMLINASELLNVMQTHPKVSIAIVSSIFSHLHSLVSQVEELKADTGPQRVAKFLLTLVPNEHERCTVTLPFEKILIAGRIGMKPESLSRAFSRLKMHGVTIRQNHAEIADVAHLREFSECENLASIEPLIVNPETL